jgi:hypothetical protein
LNFKDLSGLCLGRNIKLGVREKVLGVRGLAILFYFYLIPNP